MQDSALSAEISVNSPEKKSVQINGKNFTKSQFRNSTVIYSRRSHSKGQKNSVILQHRVLPAIFQCRYDGCGRASDIFDGSKASTSWIFEIPLRCVFFVWISKIGILIWNYFSSHQSRSLWPVLGDSHVDLHNSHFRESFELFTAYKGFSLALQFPSGLNCFELYNFLCLLDASDYLGDLEVECQTGRECWRGGWWGLFVLVSR